MAYIGFPVELNDTEIEIIEVSLIHMLEHLNTSLFGKGSQDPEIIKALNKNATSYSSRDLNVLNKKCKTLYGYACNAYKNGGVDMVVSGLKPDCVPFDQITANAVARAFKCFYDYEYRCTEYSRMKQKGEDEFYLVYVAALDSFEGILQQLGR